MGDERLEQLVAAYAAAFEGWRSLIDALGDDDWLQPTGCPGWDVKDQLAHVVSAERVMLGDREEPAELPDDLPHVRHDFGRSIEVGVQARRGTPPQNLVAEAHETFDRRLRHLRELDPAWLDEEVDGPGPGMRMRGAPLLRRRIYDLTTHEYDVRRAVGRTDEAAAGAHVETSLEMIVRGWSKVLPPAVGSDAVLGIEVDGRELGRLHLADGRRSSGEGPAADAVLSASVADLLAIAGGRKDAPPVDQVCGDGDPAVVRAVLAAATITP